MVVDAAGRLVAERREVATVWLDDGPTGATPRGPRTADHEARHHPWAGLVTVHLTVEAVLQEAVQIAVPAAPDAAGPETRPDAAADAATETPTATAKATS